MKITNIRQKYRAFAENVSGNIPILFGILITPMLLFLGSAIDYSRALKAKTSMQVALDSAALAGVNMLVRENGSAEQINQIVESTFRTSMADLVSKGAVIKSIEPTLDDKEGGVKVDAVVSMPTSLMQLVQMTELNIGASSVAKLNDKKVEISMVLDLTTSMRGSKIYALKLAALDLVRILVPDSTSKYSSEVRVGLVPYSSGVNAREYAQKATAGKSSYCATERDGEFKYTDASYIKEPIGTGSRECPYSPIVPLTKGRAVLEKNIRGFRVRGNTAGQTGLGWGWYMLSPAWSGLWPAESEPESYNPQKTTKIAILMTDGIFNTFYYHNKKYNRYDEKKWSSYSQSVSRTRVRNTCAAMKNEDIIIYTVAFMIQHGYAKNDLKKCASGIEKYYDAKNNGDLRAAFVAIANDITELRIAQ